MVEHKRFRASAYSRDEGIIRMATRLARGEITDEKAEWLARAVHGVTPWAGTPVAFDDIGQYRPEGAKARNIAEAREVLEEIAAELASEAEVE